MTTVGLLGGVAGGKSFVAQCFRDLGACVLNGDHVGHEVLTDPKIIATLVSRWGDAVQTADGQLDRAAIGRIVFAEHGSEELAYLESVTHPAIGNRLRSLIDQAHQSGRYPLVILDAAVMLKAGWDEHCDKFIYVDTPRDVRAQRAVKRGLPLEQFHQREARQTPVEEKKRIADFIIDNSGTLQKTREQVEEVWKALREIA